MLINIVGLILGLFHLVGPIPSDLGVHQGQLSICEFPTIALESNGS